MRRRAAFLALWRGLTSGAKGGPSLGQRLGAIPRMLWATLRGKYDGWGRIIAMLAAVVYIVSPIDLVPEAALLFLGLIDDAFVITWVVGAFLSETERFLEWEATGRRPPQSSSRVIDGETA